MVKHNQNLGNLFLIPSSIEQNEDIPFLLDQQKKLFKNYRILTLSPNSNLPSEMTLVVIPPCPLMAL